MGDMVPGEIRYVSLLLWSQSKRSVHFYPVTRVPQLLKPYHRSLALHIDLANQLRDHSATFENYRGIINQWVAQPHLEGAGWEAAWEEICEAEVERWSSS